MLPLMLGMFLYCVQGDPGPTGPPGFSVSMLLVCMFVHVCACVNGVCPYAPYMCGVCVCVHVDVCMCERCVSICSVHVWCVCMCAC